MRQRRPVRLQYRNHRSQSAQKRHLHPYHIAYIEHSWYLFGYDLMRKAIRTFALTRLMGLRLCGGRFEAVRFSLADYLRDSFGLFKGRDGDDYEVVVDFDAWAADEVRGHRCYDGQEMMELPKGMLRLRMRLGSLEEVEKWVISFGTHATVVRPQVLRERLRKTALEVGERYAERNSGAHEAEEHRILRREGNDGTAANFLGSI